MKTLRDMSKTFESIKRGLRQAVRHSRGRRVAGLKLHVPPQIAKEPQAVLRAVEKA